MNLCFLASLLFLFAPMALAEESPEAQDFIAKIREEIPSEICGKEGYAQCYKLSDAKCSKVASALMEKGLWLTDPPGEVAFDSKDQTPPEVSSLARLSSILPDGLSKEERQLWKNAIKAFWRRSLGRLLERRNVEGIGPCSRELAAKQPDPYSFLDAFQKVSQRDLAKMCQIASRITANRNFLRQPYDIRVQQILEPALQASSSLDFKLKMGELTEVDSFGHYRKMARYGTKVHGSAWDCEALELALQPPRFKKSELTEQPLPKTKLPPPTLSDKQVKTVMDKHLDEMTECYTAALKLERSLAGRIFTKIKVNPAGKVLQVAARKTGTTLIHGPLFECLKNKIMKVKFPSSQSKRDAVYIYPLEFKSM